MKYKFCSIRINVTKYKQLTFATRGKGGQKTLATPTSLMMTVGYPTVTRGF